MRSHQPPKYMKIDHRHLEMLINIEWQWFSGKHTTIITCIDPQTRSIQHVTMLNAQEGVKRNEESEGIE